MSPVFRPRFTRRKELPFPTITAVLEDDRRFSRPSVDLRPSHVFTIRHHPYDRRLSPMTDDGAEELHEEGVLVYEIESSFLIPDWIFNENVINNSISFENPEQELGQVRLEPQSPAALQKENVLKTTLSKVFALARKIIPTSKASQSWL